MRITLSFKYGLYHHNEDITNMILLTPSICWGHMRHVNSIKPSVLLQLVMMTKSPLNQLTFPLFLFKEQKPKNHRQNILIFARNNKTINKHIDIMGFWFIKVTSLTSTRRRQMIRLLSPSLVSDSSSPRSVWPSAVRLSCPPSRGSSWWNNELMSL